MQSCCSKKSFTSDSIIPHSIKIAYLYYWGKCTIKGKIRMHRRTLKTIILSCSYNICADDFKKCANMRTYA